MVDALRSGKYEQTTNRFKDKKGGLCCMGVLCEISNKGFFDSEDRYVCDSTYTDPDEYSTQWVPETVKKWAGLRSNIGSFIVRMNSLTGMNDAEGLTFSEIADAIECHADELFIL
jgi:hypothetical protein